MVREAPPCSGGIVAAMKRSAVFGVVLLTVLTAGGNTAGAARQARRPIEFAVGTSTLQFDVTGRQLTTTVFYPATGRAAPFDVVDAPRATRWGPYPLILFSHEFGAKPNTYGALIHAWAAHGYIVAVPTYPPPAADENAGNDQQPVIDLSERVADASFVIDRMLDRVRGGFGEIVDPKRIVAAGHALGAVTTFVLAYSTSLRDPRVDAAVTLAGRLVGDQGDYFTGVTTPLLAIHGEADTDDPITATENAFDLASPPKFYVTLLGADHSDAFVDASNPGFNVVANTTLDFLSAYIGGRVSGLQQLERDGKVSRVSKIMSQAD
jgi:dienelactone hydrolase